MPKPHLLLYLLLLSTVLPAQNRVSSVAPAVAASGASPAAATAASTPPASAAKVVFPMEAALVQSLNAKSLQAGGHVLAKLEKNWTDGACRLARGSVIRGDVLQVDAWSAAARRTAVTLLFHYTCLGLDPQALTWIALLAPEDLDLAGLHDGNPVAMQSFRSSSFGGAGNTGSPTGAAAGSPGDESGRQNPNLPVFLDHGADHSHPRPAAVKTGQVWKVPDVALHVGAGPDESTVLESKKKTLHVPAGSSIVLLPPAVAVLEGAPGKASAAPVLAAAKPAAQSFVENTVCARPACTVASASLATEGESRAAATISLHGLRYTRQSSAAMRKLDDGTALVFLGPHHLLFTFDPHTLVTREADDRPEDRPHMVRAVLFDLTTGRAERTLDWRVPDSRPYLWPVAGDRVLIHSGKRLQWLGPSLRPQTAFTPDGPVAFVRLAPDRRHIAVGVTHELHTREEHGEMAAADINGPEEQVAVHLLNGQLEPIAATYESSRALAPVLSNHGRIVLFHVGGQRWHYKAMGWGDTARDVMSSVAYVSSACLPEMSSMASDLLLVTGCENRSLDHWYRVMRPDGSLVLKGVLHPQDLAPLSAAETADGSFAMALPTGGPGYTRGSPFRGEDISAEVIRVHRAADGEVVFSTRIHEPAPANRPMALAPDGGRLAVLDGEQIHVFGLAASPPSAIAAR